MNDIKLNKENLNFYASKFSLLFLKKLDLSQNKMGDLCLEMFAMVLGLNYGKNSLSTSLK